MVNTMRSRGFVSTVAILVFLAAWEIAPRLHLVEGFYTSQPSHVLTASWEILRTPSFVKDVSVSLEEFVLGLALAVVVGVPIGLLLGTFQTLRYLVDPPIMALYATPQLALIPIYVLWLGIGMSSKVAVVFVVAVIPVIVNSIAGVRQVDPSLVLVARSFCARQHDVFRKVILPASLPSVMIGIRLGMSRGILGVVVAEMYVSQDGVGNQILKLGSAFRVDHLLFYVLLVSAFGFAATSLVRKFEEHFEGGR